MGVALNTLRVTVGEAKAPVNLYATCLGMSGSGKTSANRAFKDLLEAPMRKLYTYIQSEDLDFSLNSLAKQGLISKDSIPEFHKLYHRCGVNEYLFAGSTGAAFRQLHVKNQLARFGNLNIFLDEFGLALQEAQFEDSIKLLLEGYDLGEITLNRIKAQKDREDLVNLGVRVPINVMGLGTPELIYEDPKIATKWIAYLKTGLARRSIFSIVHPPKSHLYQEAPDPNIGESLKEMFESLLITKYAGSKGIVHTINPTYLGYNIPIQAEAQELLAEYREYNLELAKNTANEVLSIAVAGRDWIATKLAGILAFTDRSHDLRVTKECVLHAIYLLEQSYKALYKVSSPPSAAEITINILRKEQMPVSSINLKKIAHVPQSTSAFNEHIKQVKQLAALQGNPVIVQNYREISYFSIQEKPCISSIENFQLLPTEVKSEGSQITLIKTTHILLKGVQIPEDMRRFYHYRLLGKDYVLVPLTEELELPLFEYRESVLREFNLEPVHCEDYSQLPSLEQWELEGSQILPTAVLNPYEFDFN